MPKHANKAAPNKTRVEVLTADPEFERAVRDTFAIGGKIDLDVVTGTVLAHGEELGRDGVTVVVAELDASDEKEMVARITAAKKEKAALKKARAEAAKPAAPAKKRA